MAEDSIKKYYFNKLSFLEKLKIFINHLLNKHDIYTMPIYSLEYENGWFCPFCNWEHLDIADYKMRNSDGISKFFDYLGL